MATINKYFWFIIIAVILLWVISEDHKKRQHKKKRVQVQTNRHQRTRAAVLEMGMHEEYYIPDDTENDPLGHGMFTPYNTGEDITDMIKQRIADYEQADGYDHVGDLYIMGQHDNYDDGPTPYEEFNEALPGE